MHTDSAPAIPKKEREKKKLLLWLSLGFGLRFRASSWLNRLHRRTAADQITCLAATSVFNENDKPTLFTLVPFSLFACQKSSSSTCQCRLSFIKITFHSNYQVAEDETKRVRDLRRSDLFITLLCFSLADRKFSQFLTHLPQAFIHSVINGSLFESSISKLPSSFHAGQDFDSFIYRPN